MQLLGTDKAVYLGDRWVSSNLGASTYIWLPLKFDGTSVTLDWYDAWSVDVEAGDWHDSAGFQEQEGEAATLSNGATVIDCSQCSGSEAAGYIGGDDDGTATFVADLEANTRATMILRYRNGDTDPRLATVSVNDVDQTVAFLSTNHHDETVGQSVAHVDLNQGSNTMVVRGSGGWGPDVDQVLIPNN